MVSTPTGVRRKAAGREVSGDRPVPTLDWEMRVGHPKVSVVGVDEVGRGCLAGPVVAGALLLPAVVDYDSEPWLREVTDSKFVKPETRERLAPLIEKWAGACAVGVASVEEIDAINIFEASHLAMCRAILGLKGLGGTPDGASASLHVLVDGKFKPKFEVHGIVCSSDAIIQGDRQCLSIAAASIIAKVWRDRLMVQLDAEYPGYGFAVHKGYSTPEHSACLKKQGVCAIHRRTFAPVASLLGKSGCSVIPE